MVLAMMCSETLSSSTTSDCHQASELRKTGEGRHLLALACWSRHAPSDATSLINAQASRGCMQPYLPGQVQLIVQRPNSGTEADSQCC